MTPIVGTGFDAIRFTVAELRAMAEHVINGGTDPQGALSRHRATTDKQTSKR